MLMPSARNDLSFATSASQYAIVLKHASAAMQGRRSSAQNNAARWLGVDHSSDDDHDDHDDETSHKDRSPQRDCLSSPDPMLGGGPRLGPDSLSHLSHRDSRLTLRSVFMPWELEHLPKDLKIALDRAEHSQFVRDQLRSGIHASDRASQPSERSVSMHDIAMHGASVGGRKTTNMVGTLGYDQLPLVPLNDISVCGGHK
ncbi:hypothetical protein BJ742DRAFT_375971 [Cladochytrium replicatum]|nr:hypothetical protein BJ742DRAFT_375971 [Cladochytrium replicatum]